MKKFLPVIFGILLSSSAWAHHASEGVVSDEVWNMVNDLISDQHLDMDIITVTQYIDVESVMADFSVIDIEGDGSRTVMETGFLVPDDEELLAALDAIMTAAIMDVESSAFDWNDDPSASGSDENRTSSTLSYSIEPSTIEGMVYIVLTEPIGSSETPQATQAATRGK